MTRNVRISIKGYYNKPGEKFAYRGYVTERLAAKIMEVISLSPGDYSRELEREPLASEGKGI